MVRAADDSSLVAVIGAGLAGLVAGATAARAGARVVIFDSRSPGGRARTDLRDGFRLNQGPHALFNGGPGRAVLSRLSIRPKGHAPPLKGSRALIEGQPHGVFSRRILRPRSKAQVGRAMTRLMFTDPSKWIDKSAREWIDALELRSDAAMFMGAALRVNTYVADLDRLSADLAIIQLRDSFKGMGVKYLDGGWEQLTSALVSRASAAGAEIRPQTRITEVGGEPGAWQVHTSSGEVVSAAAVVVAAGGPEAGRRLLPVDPLWGELGPEVTAACLDLGVQGRRVHFHLGIDEPLYLSRHSPPGDLAPPGSALVHVMRYGARGSEEDREQLWGVAAAAGIHKADVVTERFLHRMIVASCLPPPGGGLVGRTPVEIPELPGIFLAGDWVGPVGWLAGGSLASGEQAGLRSARAAFEQRATVPLRH